MNYNINLGDPIAICVLTFKTIHKWENVTSETWEKQPTAVIKERKMSHYFIPPKLALTRISGDFWQSQIGVKNGLYAYWIFGKIKTLSLNSNLVVRTKC